MPRNLNICILTSTFPLSPNDAMQAPFLPEYIQRVVDKGHRVTVLTQERVRNPRYDWDRFHVVYFNWSVRDARISELSSSPFLNVVPLLSFFVGGVRRLLSLQRKERFDVILCCWAVPAGLIAGIARWFGGRLFPPFVTWSLGSDVYRYQNGGIVFHLLRWTLRHAAKRFADGFDLSNKVAAISGLDCDYLATSRILPAPKSPITPIQNGPVEFLFVGRHDEVKGIDVLIECLENLVHSTAFTFRVTIAGVGPLTESMQHRIQKVGLSRQVEFVGKISDEHLSELYQRSQCLVIPSRSETLPLVFGEIMRFGKPVIATDVGDMGRITREYNLGTVIRPGNSEELGQALIDFAAHPFTPKAGDCARLAEMLSAEHSVSLLCRALEETAK